MKLKLDNFRGNILVFMRSRGYTFMSRSPDDEWNFVRKIEGADYPRFHCYIKKEGPDLIINLHLDQKKPSYEGFRRHGGEYESPAVEAEAKRIGDTASRERIKDR